MTVDRPNEARRFLFVNQFLPPDPAPTARLLGEVAGELRRRGHEAILVGDRSDYRGGKTLFGSRVLREALALARLWWKTLFAPRCDAIVCLTSPPLLPVAVRAARFRHRGSKLVHWAMDLYPDVAVALGEVREGSLLHRATAKAMASLYRACDLVVVLDQDMADRIGPKRVRISIAPPWPPSTGSPEPPEAAIGGPFVWLYSGNLGRAHEWRTLLEAQGRLEKEGSAIDLVFQGGGTETDAARCHAESLGLKRCHWRGYATGEDLIASLLSADALIVTQRPETTGCLWPSKLALALLLDRPLIWVGSTGGSIATRLREAGHEVFAPGEGEALAARLRALAADRSLETVRITPDALVTVIEEARKTDISAMADRFELAARGTH